jgi:DNA-binding NtrC family response regulator
LHLIFSPVDYNDQNAQLLTTMAKILLVDDENLILYSLSATLRHDGSEVTAVANGNDALNEIRRSPYDICFLDVNLPDANGFDLMKTVQEISPATRIIIMTAVDLNDGQMSYLHNNACHFLPKPFNLEDVRSLVANISRTESAAVNEA